MVRCKKGQAYTFIGYYQLVRKYVLAPQKLTYHPVGRNVMWFLPKKLRRKANFEMPQMSRTFLALETNSQTVKVC